MTNYLYILVILFNLNLLLNVYVEIMIKMITLFNYKNTTEYSSTPSPYDIAVYIFFKNKNIFKLLIQTN